MHNNLTNLFIFFLVFLLSPVISKNVYWVGIKPFLKITIDVILV